MRFVLYCNCIDYSLCLLYHTLAFGEIPHGTECIIFTVGSMAFKMY